MSIKLNPIVDRLRSENDPVRAAVASYAQQQEENKVDKDELRKIMIAAHAPNPDPKMVTALAEAREQITNLSVWADNVLLPLFAYEPVDNSGAGLIVRRTNRRDQSFNVLETHFQGAPPNQMWATPRATQYWELARYSTGIIEYPSEHGVAGDIQVAEDVNNDLIREWDIAVNTALEALITAALTSFTDDTTYVRDSRFVSATLPTTNVISSTGEGAFTFEIFKDAVEHFDLLGKQLRLIRLNPTEMRDVWDWQDRVSSAASGSQDARELITTRLKEDIISSGRPSQAILGRQVTYLLDPTYQKKYIQIFSTEPVGTFYDAPAYSKVEQYSLQLMRVATGKSNVFGVEKEGYFKGLIYGPDATNVAEIQFDS